MAVDKLIAKVPEDANPGLRDKLVKVISDYILQLQLRRLQ